MEKQHIEKSLANAMAAPKIKSELIRLAVVRHCVDAEFVDYEDHERQTPRYLWLLETLELHLMALSLLDQIILDVSNTGCPSEIQTEIDAKAASIVKDLARRILETPNPYPFQSDEESSEDLLQSKLRGLKAI